MLAVLGRIGRAGAASGAMSYDRLTALCQSRYAYLALVLLPLFIYYPVLSGQGVLQGGTDILFHHFPNLLYGHRSLQQGDLGLWNRHLLAGVDFTQSLYHHILYPLNWLILAVPERYALQALSLQLFLEICASAFFAYRIAGLFLANPWSRLLVGITAELGGFAWFTTTTFIGVHLLFVTSAAIYVLLTGACRRALANFVLLSLCFAGILMIGHPAYVMGFGLVVGGAFLVQLRLLQGVGARLMFAGVVIAAGIAGLAMAAYRLLPVLQGVAGSDTSMSGAWLGAPPLAGYFALTGFVPEAAGLNVGDSQAISRVLGIGGRNNQFHAMFYFGIVPLLLLYLALFFRLGRLSLILALAAVTVAIAQMHLVQPLSDIFFLFVYPGNHDAVPRIAAGFLIPAAVIAALRAFDHSLPALEDRDLGIFALLAVLVVAAVTTLWLRVAGATAPAVWPVWLTAAKAATTVLILAGAVVAFRGKASRSFYRYMTAAVAAIAMIILGISFVFAVEANLLGATWLTLKTFVNNAGGMVWALAVASLARLMARDERWKTLDRIGLVACGLLGAVLLFVPIPEYGGERGAAAALAALWSALKFLVLACVLIELFALAIHRGLDRRWLIPLLVLLAAGDLLYFARNYQYVNGAPFVDRRRMYPEIAIAGLPDYERARRAAASQPELLANSRLAFRGRDLTGWQAGGANKRVEAVVGAGPVARLINVGADMATIFQDVTVQQATAVVSFGAWVRTAAAGKAGLLLTSEGKAAEDLARGTGRWEWLSVSIPLDGKRGVSVRPHAMMRGPGTVEIRSPRLVRGPVVLPAEAPPPGEMELTRAPPDAAASTSPGRRLDLVHYRVGHPDNLIRVYGQVWSHIPLVYGLPSYGGIEGYMPPGYGRFLLAFEPAPQKWLARSGVLPILENERLLDLLGVRYDFRPDGTPAVRPNALARVSLFKHYETVADGARALARLKDPAFDPATTIILDGNPGWRGAAGPASRFKPLAFASSNSGRLEIPFDEATPSVVLFNDSYSPGWRARLGGDKMRVYRANANFMAVSLPPGRGTLTLVFEPTEFLRLLAVSSASAVIVLLIAGCLAASRLFSASKRRAALRAGPLDA